MVLKEIEKSTRNRKIIEAAELVSEILTQIKANMLPLCPLALITNPCLFSGYKKTT